MTAPLPRYLIVDDAGREVAEADGYDATRAAVRYLLTSGEETGELVTYTAAGRELERAQLVDGAIVWQGRQGLRAGLR